MLARSWNGEYADAVAGSVPVVVAALGCPGDDLLMSVGDSEGELLLSAGDRALRGVRIGQRLVDVDADAVDARVAGRIEDAVAGLAGDLEEDVGLVLGDELLAEVLAGDRVVERLGEVARP